MPLPTMKDVATLAGVSQMTVSRVMRGTGYISEDVRKRVNQAARQIGYVHNRFKGGMAGYGNPLVGVIVPNLQNRVFTEVLSGINDRLGEKGLRPVFGVSDYSVETEEEIVYDLLSWRPLGLILTGLEHSEAVRKIATQTGVRVAEVMDTDGAPISACFGISHRAAGAEMARHMIERGYRRFGYLAGQGGRDLRACKRFEAFSEVVREAGAQIVDCRVSEEDSSMMLGTKLTCEMLSGQTRPDAIYTSNDDIAAGGLMYCLRNGISVPEDVALAGFNALPFLETLPLHITTTQTPRYEMGLAAAEFVATQEGEILAAPPMQPRLILGQTT
ncbi:LacI family DNA-binding transcriptional regulator [Tropicimonas sp. TH_r6]|uniref:LacI family DNA-binding transcriptional regulator n=1 Tax=Tropicimonas sp. TH_r6 TaxID=3082085 RepID=UPI002954DF7D|nr:LacI family DNA-binding transcriptional regulator [Tropicimonas sp. TH_r6]MDV7141113.1 LacI family DNA-binding transcriptional regulator [Tropicimonas sp. TH_r6]